MGFETACLNSKSKLPLFLRFCHSTVTSGILLFFQNCCWNIIWGGWILQHCHFRDHIILNEGMKSYIFWDITTCSPLRKMSPPFPCTNCKPSKKPAWKQVAKQWFLAWFIVRPWRWRRNFHSKHRLTFKGLHGVISQIKELFITTAVSISDPTEW
jgi:hypothetical protein